MSDVILLGNTQPENRHQSGNVYFVGGCSPTLMAGTHGYGFGYFMEIEKMDKRIPNILIGGMQEHQSIKTDGVCTTLTSSMGTGGGYVPMIIELEEQKPELIYQGGVRLNLHESGADGYTELYDNSI